MEIRRHIIGFFLLLTHKIKPVLMKVFPVEFLRRSKRNLVNKGVDSVVVDDRIKFDPLVYPKGVNLLGMIRAEIGLGESSRLVAGGIESTELPLMIYEYYALNPLPKKDRTWEPFISEQLKYSINIIHLNPPDLALAHIYLPRSFWDKRYNIAYWLWELEAFPEEWVGGFQYVDEVWTPAEFVSESVRKNTSLPVRTVPYGLHTAGSLGIGRKEFGFPEDLFLVLIMFDSYSTIQRKNPLGAIKAFCRAFKGKEDKVGLVVKVNNPSKEHLRILEEKLEEFPNIFWITETLEKVRVNALIKAADVYLSLHRCEGFGLIIAEAMLLGTPTIATNWSANTEFCTAETCCLVDYTLVDVGENATELYKADNRWAEPDIDQAATYLLKLYNDPLFREKIAGQAMSYLQENFTTKHMGKRISERIDEIYLKGIKGR